MTVANLTYNGSGNTATITAVNSSFYTASKTLTAPSVEADSNITFYWNTTLSSGYYKNFTSDNQTVINFNIDNCSSNTAILYNFTIVDEELQTKLDGPTQNTSGKVDLIVYDSLRSTIISNFSKFYNQTNSFSVCLSTNLSSGESYSLDNLIEYSASGYETEFYNIQNETLTNADFPTNITLRDLDSDDAQIFKIIFRDSSFLPVENALLNVSRKYIDEGVFKTVEIPKTDAKGETIVHLVVDKVIYNFQVIKFGTVLGTFSDVRAVCQNPTITSCEIDLNAFADTLSRPDFEEAEDFSFTLGYDNSTRVVSSTFSIPSGEVTMISLNVTSEDALGTSVCSDVLTSSSGTLTCVVPQSFGNSTIKAELYRSNSLQAQGNIKLDQTPIEIYGVTLVGLSIFIMMTLIGVGLSGSPIITTIFLMVGVVLLFVLNLVANNGFIGATATILWLAIAMIIILIKGVKRN